MVKMSAQDYNGLTGLLQVPSANTDSAGTFRGGFYFLHQLFTPSKFGRYNTMGYYIGLTPFRWIEVSYSPTLLRANAKSKKLTNEDRRLNVKLTPLYEGKYWPALALGWDDISTRLFKEKDDLGGNNNYFLNIYGVVSKHFDIKGYELGAHIAYRYYASDVNRDRRGIAGGVTLRPAFYRPLRVVAEWDGVGVNVGADVLLWRHLFIQTALVHGRGFTGGVSYHYTIKF